MRVSPRSRRALSALFLVALVLAGCGGNGDDGDEAATDDTVEERTTTTEATTTTDGSSEGEGADSDLCDAAQRVSDLDDESQGLLNDSLAEVMARAQAGDQEGAAAALDDMLVDVRAFIDEGLPPMVAAYDDLERSVPDHLAADVALVRDFSVDLAREMAEVEDFQQLQGIITEQQEKVSDVVEAVFRLDELTREECDIVLAD